MRITFRGLVTHATINVSGTDEQVAILPVATDHEAILAYRLEDVPGSSQTGVDCLPLPEGCFKTDLRTGKVKKMDIGDLPQLTVTTTATALSRQVLRCPPDNTLIKSIFYLPPEGKLFADHYYEEEVDFIESPLITHPHGAMPRSVIYAVWPSVTDFTITFGDGSTLKLVSTAEIVIANTCTTSTRGTHYQFYRNVLDTTVAIKVYDPKKNGTPCTFASDTEYLMECGGGSTVDVDCVNSQFP